MLRKLFYVMLCSLVIFGYSCSDDDDDVTTWEVKVKLVYPDDYAPLKGIKVSLKNSDSPFDAETDAEGIAIFKVPIGIYEASVTEKRLINGAYIHFNGVKSNLAVTDATEAEIKLEASRSAQVIIKEFYATGCQKDDGSGTFAYDRHVILYNNSNEDASLKNMALATCFPYNAHSTTNNYYKDGVLTYEKEGWIPAGQGIWYFPNEVILAPGEQIVIAFFNAVNNTATYSQSINFDNPEYYCMYDITSTFNNTTMYPAPAASIPTDHYLRAVGYGTGNAWAISAISPSLFLFVTENMTPSQFANDASYTDLYGGSTSQVAKKVDVNWVTDGIEVFTTSSDKNQKRLTATVDAGYIYTEKGLGYSLYRNVDKEATEAIEGNKEKLIYGYNGGTTGETGTTDPSGIDAEASIKKGARIIYKDTNNSSNDFHQRAKASLRD